MLLDFSKVICEFEKGTRSEAVLRSPLVTVNETSNIRLVFLSHHASLLLELELWSGDGKQRLENESSLIHVGGTWASGQPFNTSSRGIKVETSIELTLNVSAGSRYITIRASTNTIIQEDLSMTILSISCSPGYAGQSELHSSFKNCI